MTFSCEETRAVSYKEVFSYSSLTLKDVVFRMRFLMRGMMEFFMAEYSIMFENEGMMLRTISYNQRKRIYLEKSTSAR